MRRVNRINTANAAALLGLIGAVFGHCPGHAATLNANPSIALEETWDTNVFNTATDEQSDFISRATPRLAFSLVSERTAFSLSGSITSEAYADNNDLNSWDATKLVELNAARLGITENLSIQAGARYLETNDIGNRAALGLVPIPGLPPTETFVRERTAARDYGGSMNAAYQATPNVSLTVGGGVLKHEYIDKRPDLTGSRTVTGNASGSYRINPQTTCGLFGSTGYSTYDGGADSRSYSGGVSASYTVSERTNLDARVGVTFLTDSRGAGVVEHTQSPSGSLTLGYKGSGFNAAMTGSYDLTGGGSFGGGTERANVALSVGGQATPRWSWDLSGGYQNERSPGSGGRVDVSTANGSAGVRYSPAGWIFLRLGGYTFRQWNPDASDVARSHVQLAVTLSDTYHIF